MIEASPDVIPILIEAAVTSRLFYVATGFSGHGFGIGPGAGKAIADSRRGANPGNRYGGLSGSAVLATARPSFRAPASRSVHPDNAARNEVRSQTAAIGGLQGSFHLL